MEDESNEFQVIMSQAGHSFRQQQQFGSILNGCREVENLLVHEYMINSVGKIISQAEDIYQNDSPIKNVVITMQFLKNQLDQFQLFIKLITSQFEERKWSIFNDLSPQQVDIIYLTKSDVRDIVLHMFIYLEENPQFSFVVFIVKQMTDLDQYNMYCIQKGLKEKNLMLVICSHHHFQNSQFHAGEYFLKLHYQLYNPKELFCKYIYRCLINPIIRPYLPFQILRLITDMNYYTLSYHQSCRRFRFCVQRGLMLYRKERGFVDFQKLIDIIEISLHKQFKYYGAEQSQNFNIEKLLKVILSENQVLHIAEKAIVFEIAMRTCNPSDALLEQADLIKVMRQHVRNALKKHDKFKKYAEFLQEKVEEVTQKTGRKKKSRSQMLGIDTKKNITPKNKLENQITRIIKDATASIRQQASHINWQDIKYELRIKPQLPYIIREAWAGNEETAELVEQISKNYSAPLTRYLKLYEKDLGKGIYLVKCLELAGLIEIKKNQIKPLVYTNFFDKANFKVLS